MLHDWNDSGYAYRVSFLVDELILLHTASIRLNNLRGPWAKFIFLSRKLQSQPYCVYIDSVGAEHWRALMSA